MFDTRTIGKKIASLRKAKDMTQAELADAMEISYQAVSNWERGNSMPDISKLPQLSLLLGCSLDDILGESKETALMEKIIEGKQKEFMEQLQGEEEQNEVKVIKNVAPFIKSQQTQDLVEVVVHARRNRQEEDGPEGEEQKKEGKNLFKDLIALAPFLSEEYLDQLAEQADVSDGIGGLVGLAPFLSEETLDKLADRICGDGVQKDIVALAPFLSKKTVQKAAEEALKTKGVKGVTGLAPFLSEEALDKLVNEICQGGAQKDIVALAPFLPKKTIQKVAEEILKTKGAKGLAGLAPFL